MSNIQLISFVTQLEVGYSLAKHWVLDIDFLQEKLQFQKYPFKTGTGVKIVLVASIQSLSHDPSLGLLR